MASYEDLFPSKKYLKAGSDLGEEGATAVLTIKSIKVETIGEGAKAEDKPMVYFIETPKALVLNKTNGGAIAMATKEKDPSKWIGKRITLAATMVEFSGKWTLGIRVRATAPAANDPAGLKKVAEAPEGAEASM